MPLSSLDHERLQAALLAAQQAIGVSEPNPRVGCVIGRQDGALLGSGSTQHVGGPHAEVMALRQAHAAGHDLRGATAWVTLEPCPHHGRTPPCCDALIAAGLARVVVAVQDPHPQVAGRGLQRLRDAGVAVTVADGEIAAAARELNIGFFSRQERGRPWLRLKVAASLDGRSALENGVSQWITGAAARSDGHAWRKRASAVMTGIGTALTDDPRLDVRLVPTALQPLRVVVDSSLRLPLHARLLAAPGQALVATAAALNDPRALALQSTGAEVISLPAGSGQVDLAALLGALALRGVNELHVEAGARLNAALLEQGLVDELLVYMAPMLIGPGRGMAEWPALTALDASTRLRFVDAVSIGADLRLRLRTVENEAAKLPVENFDIAAFFL